MHLVFSQRDLFSWRHRHGKIASASTKSSRDSESQKGEANFSVSAKQYVGRLCNVCVRPKCSCSIRKENTQLLMSPSHGLVRMRGKWLIRVSEDNLRRERGREREKKRKSS